MVNQESKAKVNDVWIRFPKGSTQKKELQKIAERNGISMNLLMIKVVEMFLESVGEDYRLEIK